MPSVLQESKLTDFPDQAGQASNILRLHSALQSYTWHTIWHLGTKIDLSRNPPEKRRQFKATASRKLKRAMGTRRETIGPQVLGQYDKLKAGASHDIYGKAFMMGSSKEKRGLRLFRRAGEELGDDGPLEVGRLRYV